MYLDPGFGSMIIQIILACVAAGGSVFFILRRKIAKLLGKDVPELSDIDEADEDDEFFESDEVTVIEQIDEEDID